MNTRRTTDAAGESWRKWGNDRPPADALHVEEDPVWRAGRDVGRFEGMSAEPIWRRIALALAVVAIAAFVLGYALGWTALHG